MKVLNGYVLVRVEPIQEKTTAGIILGDAQKLPGRGTVEGISDDITSVKVGDKVEFLRYAALEGLDEDTRFCTEKHILAVYEG